MTVVPNLIHWGRLDRELYAIDGEYWGCLLEYLQEHAEEILRPELSGDFMTANKVRSQRAPGDQHR